MSSKSMQLLEHHLLSLQVTSRKPRVSLADHSGKSRMKTMKAKTKALAQTQAHRVFSEPVVFNVFHCWHSLQKKGSQPAVFAIPNEVMFVFSFLTFQP